MKFPFLIYAGKPMTSVLIFLLFVTFCVNSSKAQSSNSSDEGSVLVKSWKIGDGKISEQAMTLSLEEGVNEYEFEIDDITKQRRFRLRLRPTLSPTIVKQKVPCWTATLREVTKDIKTGGNIIGYDLLSRVGPEPGDYIPRENWAEILCPIEKPHPVFDGQIYPIRTERKFFIENFVVIMRVSDFQFKEKENRLKRLDLKVEFKNKEQN